MRRKFDQLLDGLRDETLRMGSMVEDELILAMRALNELDAGLAQQVVNADIQVNRMRFAIEEQCFELIVTQQPAARDLRAIVAVLNMIVDLERMGDQAKGIAKLVPDILAGAEREQPVEIGQMGRLVARMLNDSLAAYAKTDLLLAEKVASRDNEVDALYQAAFDSMMERMADTKKQKKITSAFHVLRAAQKLERFGDQVTNVAERVMYIATGYVSEYNVDDDAG